MSVGMPARSRSCTTLWLAGFALLGSCDSDTGPEEPLNVVVVVLDTLRPDHLGCYGYERETSPVLDAFAQEAFVFEQAHTTAPWTAPSLISLMTSLHPDVHGVKTFPDPGILDARITTLAEVLQGAGYATAAFTEGGYAKSTFGLGQGFDHYPANVGDDQSNTANRRASLLVGNVDRALDWLGEPREEPFFLFFHTYEPHSPLRAPQEDVQFFVPDYDETAEHAQVAAAIDKWNETGEFSVEDLRVFRRHMFHCEFSGMTFPRNGAALLEHSKQVGVSIDKFEVADDPEQLAWFRDLYDAEIRFTDRQLDRIWKALETQGVDDNTLILIVSDHGEGLGQHGQLAHGAVLYDELSRIVFLLRVPGMEPHRVPQVVSLIDAMPTVLDLVGLETPDSIQGTSLRPLLEDPQAEGHGLAFGQAVQGNEQRSVRTRRWKLIQDIDTGAFELYQVDVDPGETREVSAEFPDVLERMQALLLRQRESDVSLSERIGNETRQGGLDAETLRELDQLGYVGGDG